MEHKVRMQPRDAPVAVDERVNPCEPVVRAGSSDNQAFSACQRPISLGPTIDKTLNGFPGRR